MCQLAIYPLVAVFLTCNALVCVSQPTQGGNADRTDIRWKSKIERTLDTVLSNTNALLTQCSNTNDDEWKAEIERTMNAVLNECSSRNDDEWKANMESSMQVVLQRLESLQEEVGALVGKDCSDIVNRIETTPSGMYRISPQNSQSFDVYCDMETDAGGWTVIQRRVDASVDFYRYWDDYKVGFGDLEGNFWLGNDNIYRLTNQRQYELRIDLQDFANETVYAQYSGFSITDEDSNYTLSVGDYSGTAGNSLTYNGGHAFSTRDRDNDGRNNDDCAERHTGAWWYGDCTIANLNGQYIQGENIFNRGIIWRQWKNLDVSLKRAEMKIRPLRREGSN